MKNDKRPIPKHLAVSTRKWVKSVTDDYDLQDHQFHLLTLAAEALDRSELARLAIVKHGMTYEDKSGMPKIRPEVLVERDSKDLFRRLLRELNLSETVEDNRPPALQFGGK